MQPLLDVTRQDAIEQFTALSGQNDQRAVAEEVAVVQAAVQGRVGTFLLRLDPTLWGRFSDHTGSITVTEAGDPTAEDLYEGAALLTLKHGGTVHMLSEHDLPEVRYGAAVLRF